MTRRLALSTCRFCLLENACRLADKRKSIKWRDKSGKHTAVLLVRQYPVGKATSVRSHVRPSGNLRTTLGGFFLSSASQSSSSLEGSHLSPSGPSPFQRTRYCICLFRVLSSTILSMKYFAVDEGRLVFYLPLRVRRIGQAGMALLQAPGGASVRFASGQWRELGYCWAGGRRSEAGCGVIFRNAAGTGCNLWIYLPCS
jgi:hypothetical protein